MKRNCIYFFFNYLFKVIFFIIFNDILYKYVKLFKNLRILGKKLVLIILFGSVILILFFILILLTDITFVKTFVLLTLDNRPFINEVNAYLWYFTNWEKIIE